MEKNVVEFLSTPFHIPAMLHSELEIRWVRILMNGIKTAGLAGGLSKPYKGLLLAAHPCMNIRQPRELLSYR